MQEYSDGTAIVLGMDRRRSIGIWYWLSVTDGFTQRQLAAHQILRRWWWTIMPNPLFQTVSIRGEDIKVVQTFKDLDVHLDNTMDWSTRTDVAYRKGQTQLFFLLRLRSCVLKRCICFISGN